MPTVIARQAVRSKVSASSMESSILMVKVKCHGCRRKVSISPSTVTSFAIVWCEPCIETCDACGEPAKLTRDSQQRLCQACVSLVRDVVVMAEKQRKR